MELKDMNLQDVEARLAEIDGLVQTSESEEEIKSLTEEMKELETRKAELKDLEERKQAAAEIQEGKTSAEVITIEERKGEEKMKDIKEYRNSVEYINAFAEYVKTGNADEWVLGEGDFEIEEGASLTIYFESTDMSPFFLDNVEIKAMN